VNAAPPYFVNDIYKRYIRPDAPPKTYVRLSYIASFAVVVIGVLIGWNVTSVNAVVVWIVSGLWGGYTASNVLKWYWWRFNGYGYFWGMVAGIASALTLPLIIEKVPLVADAPGPLFHQSGCFHRLPAGAGHLRCRLPSRHIPDQAGRRRRAEGLLSPCAAMGLLGPVLKMVLAEDPGFKRNEDFLRDMFNIAVGIVWQIAWWCCRFTS